MKRAASGQGKKGISPWFWVPSLYFAEGIPYIVVVTISVIMYKRMGISNADIAFYTSWLYLPWVIKPLWSPLVDLFRTKRFWIITMQFLLGAGLACIALTIPVPDFFRFTLAFFWLLAFSSATHDIAADGFYMLGLSQHQQAWFVGVRGTFYRFAMLTGQGLLVILAGFIESHSGLKSVNIHVSSSTSPVMSEQVMSPDSIRILSSAADNLVIVPVYDSLRISMVSRSKQEIDNIRQIADQWNTAQGHIDDKTFNSNPSGEKVSESLWQKWIVHNIKILLQKAFGVKEKLEKFGDTGGNFGVVYFHLSKQPEPGKEYVLTFGNDSGDKSIGLIEGARAVFTEKTWNKPLMAVIQLDPKLKQETSSLFVARAGNIPLSWIVTFLFMTALFAVFSIYHYFILPFPKEDITRKSQSFKSFLRDFSNTFVLFFKRDKIGLMIAFLLLYRLGESQLLKIASPFLLDPREAGGLGLTTGQVGFVYGTVGIMCLTIGGLIGGFVAARHGLKKWIFWMALAINIPDAVYIYLSSYLPDNFIIISLCVGIEQLGYGFGFTAYMLYMIYVSDGPYKAAHFAITTGFMALGMMFPGMISGWIQEIIGYPNFFIWVLINTIPGIILVKLIPLDPEFGKKND